MKKMKKVVIGSLTVSLLSFMACSSAPRVESAETKPDPVIEYEGPGFITRAQYPKVEPVWAGDFEKFKLAQSGKGVSYFMGESGDVNDRVAGCELAGLMAKRRIAEQIAEMVMSKIGSGKSGVLTLDRDSRAPSSLGSDFQDMVAGQSTAFLVGVVHSGEFWEERDYTKSGGRRRVYQCQVLVSMDDAHLRDAIRRTGQKLGATATDSDAKALVDSAFRKLESGFDAAKEAVRDEEVKMSQIKVAKVQSDNRMTPEPTPNQGILDEASPRVPGHVPGTVPGNDNIDKTE